MHTRAEQLAAFDRLLTIMDELRERCPWDRKQTFDSLRENTIEETFELASAISKHDMNEISKELGDVLLHVVFYAKMGSETGDFDIADVCNRLCDKLIFRHPHVYGEAAAADAEQVSHLWEQVKLKENKAYRIQDKVAGVGFDWENREDVWEKVHEELDELQAELAQVDGGNKEQEFGDLLFAMINAARLYKIRPDNALEQTNLKFMRRLRWMRSGTRQRKMSPVKDSSCGIKDSNLHSCRNQILSLARLPIPPMPRAFGKLRC